MEHDGQSLWAKGLNFKLYLVCPLNKPQFLELGCNITFQIIYIYFFKTILLYQIDFSMFS